MAPRVLLGEALKKELLSWRGKAVDNEEELIKVGDKENGFNLAWVECWVWFWGVD